MLYFLHRFLQQMEKKISVIIPTLNEEQNIAKCLDAIYHQCMPTSDFEVIIVDDYSQDKTVDIAKEYAKRYGNIRIFKAHSNIGEARDIAVKKAKNKIIFSTDADAILNRRCHLGKIRQDFDRYKIITWAGPIQDPDFEFQNLIIEGGLLSGGAVCGANFAFLKTAYEKAGGFPRIDIGEDNALFWKLKSLNLDGHMYRHKYSVIMQYSIFEWAENTLASRFGDC